MTTDPVSTEQMRVLELNAEYLGINLGVLMQNAGREVARTIERTEALTGKTVVVLCGLGGNGGDGMVAARHLLENGATVEVYLIGSASNFTSSDTAFNWQILGNLRDIKRNQLLTERDVKDCKSIAQADILLDAMLGFGQKGKVREPMLTAVKAFNASKARKYAVDIPTGIDSDTGSSYGSAVRADVTVTMHAPKVGLRIAAEYAGKIVVVPIGIPPEAERVCGPGDLWLFNRPRRPESKKGDFGRILVVGGSDVYSGAPALSGLAALRTGADLVTIMVPEPVVSAVRAYSPNLMVRSFGTRVLTAQSIDAVLSVTGTCDVVALGPGLGLEAETHDAVQTIVSELAAKGKRMVIDADGLKAIAGSNIRLSQDSCVLTPHWGELKILLQEKDERAAELEQRIAAAAKAADKFTSVILLKGAVDVVALPGGTHKLNRTGVPAMTVGGTGDVLTGIVAALLARGKTAFESAAAAAFISGKAGEAAFADLGDHLTATDCIAKIPSAMR